MRSMRKMTWLLSLSVATLVSRVESSYAMDVEQHQVAATVAEKFTRGRTLTPLEAFDIIDATAKGGDFISLLGDCAGAANHSRLFISSFMGKQRGRYSVSITVMMKPFDRSNVKHQEQEGTKEDLKDLVASVGRCCSRFTVIVFDGVVRVKVDSTGVIESVSIDRRKPKPSPADPVQE